jgi:hypothetical protein
MDYPDNADLLISSSCGSPLMISGSVLTSRVAIPTEACGNAASLNEIGPSRVLLAQPGASNPGGTDKFSNPNISAVPYMQSSFKFNRLLFES